MASFEVTLKDRSVELVADAHAYQQEGQMTTFFRNDEERAVVDSWSSRIFSVRTSEILMIRQLEDARRGGADGAGRDVASMPSCSRPLSLRPTAALRTVER